jgi:RNA polymerase sigma-70 factor (ECF subfamily)
MKGPSDDLELLVRRARRGDAAAFEELVRRHEAKVFSIALKMTSNPHDARDAAQETFLRAFRSLSSFDPTRDFGVWLARIAVNCSHDLVRERRRFDRSASLDELFAGNPGVLLHEPAVPPEERMDRERMFKALLRILPSLPEKQRAALVLKDFEGYETSEVAEALACDETTVRRHLSEARAKVRAALEREFPSS